MNQQAKCSLCGEPMPPGEEMFKFHGYSGTCPKPPRPRPLDIVDNRVQCPVCKMPADLADETVHVGTAPEQRERPIWECPSPTCGYRFVELCMACVRELMEE